MNAQRRATLGHPVRRALSSLLLMLLAAVGCNTLPVGEDGLVRIPAADSVVLRPDSSAGIARYAVLGDADTMFLGRDEQYVSHVLINFLLPDSALDSITRAELILHPADSTRLAFVCHPCTVSWLANAATWRLADSATHWRNPGGDFSPVVLCRDTFQGESLVVELNLNALPFLVREAYGVLLIPDTAASPLDTGFVRISSGFSLATAPRVKLYWGAERKETRIINAIEDTHIVDTIGIRTIPGHQRVGSGFAFRTWLHFSLADIPPEATIARAELHFTPEVEHRREDTLSLGIRRLLEPFETRGRNPRFADAPSGRLRYSAEPDTVVPAVIDISRLVQYWTAHPDSNFGLFLVAEPEWVDFFRLRVPGSGPAAPRLEVLYALPPSGRLW